MPFKLHNSQMVTYLKGGTTKLVKLPQRNERAMISLQLLDALIVDLLMDNHSDGHSTTPDWISREFNNVADAGAKELSGPTLCCAQLGFSVLLTACAGVSKRRLLFDAGPEGAIWARNCRNLGIDLSSVDAVAASHGHWDHMGALTVALDEITAGGKRVPCHVNPDMFVERGGKLSDGRMLPFQKVPPPNELTAHGADVISDRSERTLLDDYFYLSGEIPRVTKFETGRKDHMSRASENDPWQPDPWIMDERYLAVNIANRGIVVLSACSHAGIINVLESVRQKFGNTPIYAVFGGLHLVGSLEAIIPETVDNMKRFNPAHIFPAHCSGFRAQNALLNAFSERVVIPCAVGSKYRL